MSVREPDPELVAAAREAHLQAYCPYSHYRVGAAIRTVSGSVIVGCNVENAAYPLGSCAEAGAIAAMVVAGERDIAEIVVVTDGDEPGTPCGGCRQRIREFAGPGVGVHSVSRVGRGVVDDRGGAPAALVRSRIPRRLTDSSSSLNLSQ